MKTRCLLLLSVMIAILSARSAIAADPSVTVNPKTIEIGSFFNGTALQAKGEIPADSEVMLRLLGESGDVPMKRKGKLFGLMWMNLDSLLVRKAPAVCMVCPGPGLEKLSRAGDSELDSLGLAGLSRSVEIESQDANKEALFKEFMKLKEEEGLYREVAGTVTYGPPAGGLKNFVANIPVPSRLSPGNYRLDMAIIKDGRITGQSSEFVLAELVGFPEMISSMAHIHAAWYGILSTAIALIAGLGIGLVFQSREAH